MAWSYVDGSYSKEWLPSGASAKRKLAARLYYNPGTTVTETTYSIQAYTQETVYKDNLGLTVNGQQWATNSSTATGSKKYTHSSSGTNHTGVYYTVVSTQTYTYTRTTENYNITINGKAYKSNDSSVSSTASKSITIPKRNSFLYTYDANGGTVDRETDLHYYDYATTLPTPVLPGYVCVGWQTPGGQIYSPGTTANINAATTFTAVWNNTYKLGSLTINDIYRTNLLNNKAKNGTGITVNAHYATGTNEGLPLDSTIIIYYREKGTQDWTELIREEVQNEGDIVLHGGAQQHTFDVERDYEIRVSMADEYYEIEKILDIYSYTPNIDVLSVRTDKQLISLFEDAPSNGEYWGDKGVEGLYLSAIKEYEPTDVYFDWEFNWDDFRVHDLPDKFIELEFLESTGQQCIDTGIFGDTNKTKIEIDGQFTNITSLQQRIFGATLDTSTTGYMSMDMYINGSGGVSYSAQNNIGNWTVIQSKADFNRHLYGLDLVNNQAYIDSTVLTITATHTTRTLGSLMLFGTHFNSASNLYWKGYFRFFGCKIYENNVLVRDYIPCYSVELRKHGVFDLVNREFITSATEYDFIGGPFIYENTEYNNIVAELYKLSYTDNSWQNIFEAAPTMEDENGWDFKKDGRLITFGNQVTEDNDLQGIIISSPEKDSDIYFDLDDNFEDDKRLHELLDTFNLQEIDTNVDDEVLSLSIRNNNNLVSLGRDCSTNTSIKGLQISKGSWTSRDLIIGFNNTSTIDRFFTELLHDMKIEEELLPGKHGISVNTITNGWRYGHVEGQGYYNVGDTVVLTAAAADGCFIQYWIENGVIKQHGGATYTLNNIDRDREVKIIFKKIDTSEQTERHLPYTLSHKIEGGQYPDVDNSMREPYPSEDLYISDDLYPREG